jgi:LysM repeat protein
VAQKAGKAAPAIAVVGALAAAPQMHKAAPLGHPAAAKQVARLDAAIFPAARMADRTYTVRAGDTLSGIAHRFYGQTGAWTWLYHVNRAVLSDPGLIYAGQHLSIPPDPPASVTSHQARAGSGNYVPRHSAASPPATHAVAPSAPAPQDGTYSYAALEQLWVQAGGNPADEAFAACIAEHESGGNPGAISPTVDYGLWQEHDDPAALNPAVSARTAVQMSADGTNWSPWTTEPDC